MPVKKALRSFTLKMATWRYIVITISIRKSSHNLIMSITHFFCMAPACWRANKALMLSGAYQSFLHLLHWKGREKRRYSEKYRGHFWSSLNPVIILSIHPSLSFIRVAKLAVCLSVDLMFTCLSASPSSSSLFFFHLSLLSLFPCSTSAIFRYRDATLCSIGHCPLWVRCPA